MSDSVLDGVPAEKIESVWRFVEPFIARACKRTRGRYEPEDIRLLLERRDAQLWLSLRDNLIEAACVSEIVCFPNKEVCRVKICRLFLASGKRYEHWLPFKPTVKAWAKAHGCKEFEIIGRRGWLRVLKDWKMTNIILFEEI